MSRSTSCKIAVIVIPQPRLAEADKRRRSSHGIDRLLPTASIESLSLLYSAEQASKVVIDEFDVRIGLGQRARRTLQSNDCGTGLVR